MRGGGLCDRRRLLSGHHQPPACPVRPPLTGRPKGHGGPEPPCTASLCCLALLVEQRFSNGHALLFSCRLAVVVRRRNVLVHSAGYPPISAAAFSVMSNRYSKCFRLMWSISVFCIFFNPAAAKRRFLHHSLAQAQCSRGSSARGCSNCSHLEAGVGEQGASSRH